MWKTTTISFVSQSNKAAASIRIETRRLCLNWIRFRKWILLVTRVREAPESSKRLSLIYLHFKYLRTKLSEEFWHVYSVSPPTTKKKRDDDRFEIQNQLISIMVWLCENVNRQSAWGLNLTSCNTSQNEFVLQFFDFCFTNAVHGWNEIKFNFSVNIFETLCRTLNQILLRRRFWAEKAENCDNNKTIFFRKSKLCTLLQLYKCNTPDSLLSSSFHSFIMITSADFLLSQANVHWRQALASLSA